MHYLIPILFCRGIIRYHVFISHPALSLPNIHTFTYMPCVDFMGKVCELHLRYVLLSWLVRGERLKPNYHFFMCWSEGLAKHRLRDNSGYNEHMHNNTYYARASGDGEIPVWSGQWRGSVKLAYRVSGLFTATLEKTELLRTAYRVHLREVISEGTVKFAGKSLKAINRLTHT